MRVTRAVSSRASVTISVTGYAANRGIDVSGADAGAAHAVPEDPAVRGDRVAPTPGRRRVEEHLGAVNDEVERRCGQVPADRDG